MIIPSHVLEILVDILNYLNSLNKHLKFIMETEFKGTVNFLDVCIKMLIVKYPLDGFVKLLIPSEFNTLILQNGILLRQNNTKLI